MGIFHCKSCFKDYTIDTTSNDQNNNLIKKDVEEIVLNEIKLTVINNQVSKEDNVIENLNDNQISKKDSLQMIPRDLKEFKTLDLSTKEKGNLETNLLNDKNKFNVLAMLKENKNYLTKQPSISFENGISYEGEWLQFKRHGHGVQTFPCGTIYEGQWSIDEVNGEGFLVHPSGENYKGQWKRDRADGYGIQKFNNGRSYKGYFKDSLFHGVGTETMGDRAVYNGQFRLGN